MGLYGQTVRDTGPLVLTGCSSLLDPLKLLGHTVLQDQLILLERPDKLKMIDIYGCRNQLKRLGIWQQLECQAQGVYPITNAYLGTFLNIQDTEYIIITFTNCKILTKGKILIVFNFSKSALLREMGWHSYSNDALEYHFGLDSRNPHRLEP